MNCFLRLLGIVSVLFLFINFTNTVEAQSFRTTCPYVTASWPYPTQADWMGCPPATFTNQNGILCPTNYSIKPFQDCCGAQTICSNTQTVYNLGFASNSAFNTSICGQGCSLTDLPPVGTTCFGVNERQTSWFTIQINPLPGGPTRLGAPAGKLRFKIIPCDIPPNPPNCDEITSSPICNCDTLNLSASRFCSDFGGSNFGGNTDLDWILFRVSDFRTQSSACNSIASNNSSVVCCNWSGLTGPTGMFEAGATPPSCDQGAQGTRFGAPIPVFVGDVFVLAVDQFSGIIGGKSYKIDFSGPCANTALNGATAIVGGEQFAFNNLKRTQVSSIISPIDSCSVSGFNFSFNQAQNNASITPNKFKLLRLNDGGEIIDSNIAITSLLPINSPITASEWSLRATSLPRGNYAFRFRDSVQSSCGVLLNADTFNFRVGPAAPVITVVNSDSCLLQPTTLKVLNANYYDFLWSNGSTADSAIVTGAGIYNLSVRRRGVCTERFMTTFNLTQPSLRNCPISISINNSLDSLSASLSALRYQWELDGNALDRTTRNIPVSGNGSYRVRAINGSDTGIWSAPFLVTNITGLQQIIGLQVYPNPSKGLVYIQVPANAQMVELVSPLGKVVLSKPVKGSTTINVQGYPKGSYIVRTKAGTQVWSTILMVQ